jgi:hypothetical protein
MAKAAFNVLELEDGFLFTSAVGSSGRGEGYKL